MKTTMMFRSIANPRRTTLAHLTEDEAAVALTGTEPQAAQQQESAPNPLPLTTANPRRTTLVEAPTS